MHYSQQCTCHLFCTPDCTRGPSCVNCLYLLKENGYIYFPHHYAGRKWDFNLLYTKKGCTELLGVSNPSTLHAIEKTIIKKELARYCRRQIRGTEMSLQQIEDLLFTFGTVTWCAYIVLIRGGGLYQLWRPQNVEGF